MDTKKGLFCLVVFLLLQLPGYWSIPKKQGIASQVVRSITVTSQEPGGPFLRYYEDPVKMQRVLLHIRTLGPLFSPDLDPEPLLAPTICITLTCADGTRKVYRQKAERYFRSGDTAWQQMPPEKGNSLLQILQETPSDLPPENS